MLVDLVVSLLFALSAYIHSIPIRTFEGILIEFLQGYSNSLGYDKVALALTTTAQNANKFTSRNHPMLHR